MINLKKIPPVDEILLHEDVQGLLSKFNRDYVINLLRTVIDDIREELRSLPEEIERDLIKQEVIKRLQKKVEQSARGTLEKVINGTGVVLHTNLGRAPMGERALNYMSAMAVNYNNLEMDLEQGERGSRYVHVEDILTRLTGAEANRQHAASIRMLRAAGPDRHPRPACDRRGLHRVAGVGRQPGDEEARDAGRRGEDQRTQRCAEIDREQHRGPAHSRPCKRPIVAADQRRRVRAGARVRALQHLQEAH